MLTTLQYRIVHYCFATSLDIACSTELRYFFHALGSISLSFWITLNVWVSRSGSWSVSSCEDMRVIGRLHYAHHMHVNVLLFYIYTWKLFTQLYFIYYRNSATISSEVGGNYIKTTNFTIQYFVIQLFFGYNLIVFIVNQIYQTILLIKKSGFIHTCTMHEISE